jgi:heme-degrading monooxygenase HmoA
MGSFPHVVATGAAYPDRAAARTSSGAVPQNNGLQREERVPKQGQPYSAGNWTVKAGHEAAFIEQWSAFTRWSAENAPGAESFVLIQATDNPRHFVSVGAWQDADAVQAWRQRPEFQELFSKCRQLCEEMSAGDYTLRSIQTP